MTAQLCAGLLIVVAALALRPQSVQPLEREAEQLLTDDARPFASIAGLADRLGQELARETAADRQARLALLWIRTMRRAFARIPVAIDATQREPYRTWLTAHEHELFYAEPADEWKLMHAPLWSRHDAIRGTTSAEPFAWEVVENGLGGECEGYPPCYLAGINLLEAEYLRRHPRGAHAAEAVARIAASNKQSVDLLKRPDARSFFRPATDCVDLVPNATAVRSALLGAGAGTTSAVALLDVLRAHCP